MFKPLGSTAGPRAKSALSASPIYDLRGVSVEEVDNRLELRGSVASYYHKQMAQEAVLAVADGREVVNEIVVCGDVRVVFYD